MLRNIIFALFVFIVIGIVVVWAVSGGPRKVYEGVQASLENATTSQGFTLPWQPDNLFPIINEEDLYQGSLPEGYAGFKEEFTDDESKTLGERSPHSGEVTIRSYGSNPSGDISSEFVILDAERSNTAPISLSGWSIQSAVTNIRVPLPDAAPVLVSGSINTMTSVSLPPGSAVIVTSQSSPVGGSFRENSCTGYLAQFQEFTPSLSSSCPSPSEELPLSADAIAGYGGNCIDFARSLPSCTFPTSLPAELSQGCRSFIQSTFTYNACVEKHKTDVGFYYDSWRLFIGAQQELWLNDHDAIRLLDEEGRIVDTYTY